MIFRLGLDTLLTGAAVGTYKSMWCLQNAATAGHRVRLRELFIAGRGNAEDLNVRIRVAASDGTTDGDTTDGSGLIVAADPTSVIVTRLDAILYNVATEPTVVGDAQFMGAFNTRGQLHKIWDPAKPHLMPYAAADESLVIQAAPSTTTAANLAGFIEWQED